MVVNGVPVRKDHHTESVAAMALDILQSVKELKDPSTEEQLTVTIGERVDGCHMVTFECLFLHLIELLLHFKATLGAQTKIIFSR